MAGWIDRWREATVAIGRIERMALKQPSGTVAEVECFAVVGTGVVFGLEEGRASNRWLVTARHVFSDPQERWEPATLHLLFSWAIDRRGHRLFSVPIQLRQRNHPRWLPHPDPAVDLACLPLTFRPHQVGKESLPRIAFGEVATTDDIYEGAPVVILGYPGAVEPSYWPRAIVRQGIIAWVSKRNPGFEVFLVDGHVLPGNSGGPVFKLPAGTDRQGRFSLGGNVALLGIVTQARIQNLPLMAGGKEVEVEFKGKKMSQVLLVPNFMGIGVVEPAARVRQLLDTARRSRKSKRRSR